MPISTQKFGSEGQFRRFDRFHFQPSQRSARLVIQCRVCNFEPELDGPLPKVCPKCHASVWEWIVRRHNCQPSERAGHRFRMRRRLLVPARAGPV